MGVGERAAAGVRAAGLVKLYSEGGAVGGRELRAVELARFFGQDPLVWVGKFLAAAPAVQAMLLAAMDLIKSRER